MMLRALNGSNSVYLAVLFTRGFFTHFEAPSVRDGSPSVRCKVQVKAMQPVLTGIRSVESTRIALAKSGVTSYIIFQHQCSSGAVKTHALMYEDTEVFAAVYDRAQASHNFVVSCRTLDTALEHLGVPQEVFVQASDAGIEFRAHHFGPALGGKAAFREDLAHKAHVEASVSIRADDLERVCVSDTAPGVGSDEDGRPTASFVTTLSEMRAMLEFCRAPAVDIGHLSFYFDSEDGAPILVTSERNEDLGIVVDQVMATIADEDAAGGAPPRDGTSAAPAERTALAAAAEHDDGTPARGPESKRPRPAGH